MSWRFYAVRSTTGEVLHADVPMLADLTWELGGSGNVAGAIPAAFDVDKAVDGLPLWWERGTTLLAEEGEQLKWAGLCSWQRPTPAGREVEFKGITSALDLIGFTGRIREWQPDPFDLVQRLVDDAQEQPDGDVGLHVVTDGKAPTYAGDEEPPSERPEKVSRRRGETVEHFAERQEDRAKLQEEWDKEYGDRRPYSLAWWEAPYVGEEIRELAREIPFDWTEQHRWTNRANVQARHELVLTPRRGRQRSDVALVEGINIGAVLDPTTDVDGYGNHLIYLGAGEGRKMRRAAIGRQDGRVRTTRYAQAKHVHNEERLRARARQRFGRMGVAQVLDQAVMRGSVTGIELGDEVRVESRLFTGWCRVYSVTRNSRSDATTLTFTPTGGDTA